MKGVYSGVSVISLNLVQDQKSSEMPHMVEGKEVGPTSSTSVDELPSCFQAVVGKKVSFKR